MLGRTRGGESTRGPAWRRWQVAITPTEAGFHFREEVSERGGPWATVLLSPDGQVDCPPKGLDTLRVAGPREVACLDLTGSGAKTIADLRGEPRGDPRRQHCARRATRTRRNDPPPVPGTRRGRPPEYPRAR
jgi:hypothetical protein